MRSSTVYQDALISWQLTYDKIDIDTTNRKPCTILYTLSCVLSRDYCHVYNICAGGISACCELEWLN